MLDTNEELTAKASLFLISMMGSVATYGPDMSTTKEDLVFDLMAAAEVMEAKGLPIDFDAAAAVTAIANFVSVLNTVEARAEARAKGESNA